MSWKLLMSSKILKDKIPLYFNLIVHFHGSATVSGSRNLMNMPLQRCPFPGNRLVLMCLDGWFYQAEVMLV